MWQMVKRHSPDCHSCEKVMQDYNQNRNGRSLRKYCKDEAVDYNWLMEFKKTFSASSPQIRRPVLSFIPLSLEEDPPKQKFTPDYPCHPSMDALALGCGYVGTRVLER